MIDTDKYEGHTPAPWDWFPTPNDSHIGHLQRHSNLTRVTAEIKSRSAEDDANAELIADAPLLLEEVKRLRERNEKQQLELFWLTDSMDEVQQQDTDELKQRAVHPSIANFVQRLAEWGFNNCDNGYVWEAMRGIIEAGERGDLDDLIGCYDDDEADEYFKNKEASE